MRIRGALAAAAFVVTCLPSAAPADPRPPMRGRLTPTNVTLAMSEGQTRRLDYTLDLPAEPTRADLYLLVDTSAGMRPLLPAVRRGLADAAVSMPRWDVRLGVGEFRTTSLSDWHDDLTYRLLRQPGPVDRELFSTLDTLGEDEARLSQVPPGERAHTVALDEAVTGDGNWPYVDPGSAVKFRADARKVMVVVTDAPFAADDPTQPDRADAIATLRAAGVEVFGLALNAAALGDLTAVASGTGAVSHRAVDCGGGRRIAAGRPAACVASPASFPGTLAGMLYQRNPASVTVTMTGRVRRLEPRAWTVDLNTPSRLRMRLDAGCAVGDVGAYAVTLTASVRGAIVAKAYLEVHCGRTQQAQRA